ncbi:MAG: hypothetical protein U0636_00135 [Phycisphaerales bacterium]
MLIAQGSLRLISALMVAAPVSAEGENRLELLIEQVRAQAAVLADCYTEVRIRDLGVRSAEREDTLIASPRPETSYRIEYSPQEIRWDVSRGAFVDSKTDEAHRDNRAIDRSIRWDGAKWAIYDRIAGAILIDGSFRPEAPMSSLAYFNLWPMRTFGGTDGLPGLLGRSTLVGNACEGDDEIVNLDLGVGRTEIRLRLTGPKHNLLKSLDMVAFDGPPTKSDRRAMTKFHYEVLDWQDAGGSQRVPRRAICQYSALAVASDVHREPRTQTYELVREELELGARRRDHSLAALNPPFGTLVYDDLLRLSYRNGSTQMSVDGSDRMGDVDAVWGDVSAAWIAEHFGSDWRRESSGRAAIRIAGAALGGLLAFGLYAVAARRTKGLGDTA